MACHCQQASREPCEPQAAVAVACLQAHVSRGLMPDGCLGDAGEGFLVASPELPLHFRSRGVLSRYARHRGSR